MKVAIPQPCHEDWNKMSPVEKGAFCASCQKVVRDFSNDSEDEIVHYLLAHHGEKVCGRFAVQQVMPNVKMEVRALPVISDPFRIFACAVILVFGGALFRCTTVKGENVNAIEFTGDTVPAEEAATLIREPFAPLLTSEIPDPSKTVEKKENVSIDSVEKKDTVKKPVVFIPPVIYNMGPPEMIMGPTPIEYSWSIEISNPWPPPSVVAVVDPEMVFGNMITGTMISCPSAQPDPPYPFTESAELPQLRLEQGPSDEVMENHSKKKDEGIVIKQPQFLTEENDFPSIRQEPGNSL